MCSATTNEKQKESKLKKSRYVHMIVIVLNAVNIRNIIDRKMYLKLSYISAASLPMLKYSMPTSRLIQRCITIRENASAGSLRKQIKLRTISRYHCLKNDVAYVPFAPQHFAAEVIWSEMIFGFLARLGD